MPRAVAVIVCLLLALPILPGALLERSALGAVSRPARETHEARTRRIEDAISNWGGNTPRLLEVQAELRRIVQVNPNDAWAHTQLARAEYRLGFWSGEDYDPAALKRAQALAARALALDPRHFDAYLTAANIARYQGDLARARRLLTEAGALDPRSPSVSIGLANIDRAEGKLDAALAQLRAVIAAHPNDRDALLDAYGAVALIHRERQEWALRYDQAIEHATAALEQMDFGAARMVLSSAYYRKGWDLYLQKKLDEARPHFEAAIQAHPGNHASYYGLGTFFHAKALETRDRKEAFELLRRAERAYEHALSLKPGDSVVRDALGRVRRAQQWLRRSS